MTGTRSSLLRRVLVVAGKASVAVLLTGWLLRSGTLDLAALGLVFHRPGLFAAALAVFALNVTLGALRWRGLLRLAGVQLSMVHALRWQLIGVFFNVVVPGNIGGDVVKSMYVAKPLPAAQRPTVFLIALIDRCVGVAALIVVAVVAAIIRGPVMWHAPALRELTGAIAILAVLTLVAPLVLLVVIRRTGDRLERWPGGTTRLARLLARLLSAARLGAARPGPLIAALVLAIALQVACVLLFAALTVAVTHQEAPLSTIASVFPLGVLTSVVPISPAGIGVGHVAFDRLFAIVGLRGGATVFNVYLISQITPCLLGAIPYVSARRNPPRSAATADATSSYPRIEASPSTTPGPAEDRPARSPGPEGEPGGG